MRKTPNFWLKELWGVPVWLWVSGLFGAVVPILLVRFAPLFGMAYITGGLALVIVFVRSRPKPQKPIARAKLDIGDCFYQDQSDDGHKRLYVKVTNPEPFPSKPPVLWLNLCYSCSPDGMPRVGGNGIGSVSIRSAAKHTEVFEAGETKFLMVLDDQEPSSPSDMRSMYEMENRGGLKVGNALYKAGSPLTLMAQEPDLYWIECTWAGSTVPSARPKMGMGQQAEPVPSQL